MSAHFGLAKRAVRWQHVAMRKLAPYALAFSAALLIGADAPPKLPQMAANLRAKTYPKSPAQIVSEAPPAEWQMIDPADLLVMELAADAKGQPRHVIIQLMPAPFSQGWVGNMRKLASAHWWDGTSVYRVQDNYVAQWGDGEGEDKSKAKPLPQGLAVVPESEYSVTTKLRFDLALKNDIFAGQAGYIKGWPFASNPTSYAPIHCYGTIGVARDLSPDTGTGAELYAIIGQPARALDRNIAVVGRVIEGISYLSSLPRGPAPMGVYTDLAMRTPIISLRLASELPEVDRPKFQYLSTSSPTFAQYVAAIPSFTSPFFINPSGGADICAVRVPVRRVKL
ncbi:MAG: hypothetical protein RLY97_1927 [Pseudomonadota bacterium]